MKFDLMFYANYVNILKDYKKLNKSLFNQILDIYQVDKCPDNFEIEIDESIINAVYDEYLKLLADIPKN